MWRISTGNGLWFQNLGNVKVRPMGFYTESEVLVAMRWLEATFPLEQPVRARAIRRMERRAKADARELARTDARCGPRLRCVEIALTHRVPRRAYRVPRCAAPRASVRIAPRWALPFIISGVARPDAWHWQPSNCDAGTVVPSGLLRTILSRGNRVGYASPL